MTPEELQFPVKPEVDEKCTLIVILGIILPKWPEWQAAKLGSREHFGGAKVWAQVSCRVTYPLARDQHQCKVKEQKRQKVRFIRHIDHIGH